MSSSSTRAVLLSNENTTQVTFSSWSKSESLKNQSCCKRKTREDEQIDKTEAIAMNSVNILLLTCTMRVSTIL